MEQNVLKQSVPKISEKEIVEYAEKKQLLLEPSAINILREEANFRAVVDKAAKDGLFILTAEYATNALRAKDEKATQSEVVVIGRSRYRPIAKEIEPNFRVLEEFDVTGKTSSGGKVDDFLTFFRSKFEFLSEVLQKRVDFKPKPIGNVKKLQKNDKVEFIGMVRDKWKSKKGNLVVTVEDMDDDVTVWLPNNDRQMAQATEKILLDDVVGIRATVISKDMVAAKEIIWPDLPQRSFKKAERDLSIVSTSDIHVGSKLFMEDEFQKFISWLRGDLSSAEKDLEKIGKIKYFVIAGDNVDGIGIYPDQFDELAIKDIYGQYEKLCTFIEQIPEYIEVFICPGQHDATRRADPQPAIPKEFFGDVADLKNIHLIGSPGWINIENLNTLVYHGASLHDLYSTVNYLDPTKPHLAMIELLRRRDLMVSYGMKQPYVPEKRDYLTIRLEPDIYFGGDMHHVGYDTYRGCMVVNNSAWQKQTAFQLKLGHVPTPGIVPVINLKSGTLNEYRFVE